MGAPLQGIVGSRYARTRLLGKGAQGAVYECFDVYTGHKFACKSFDVTGTSSTCKEFEAEVRALSALRDHHNVVKLIDIIRGDSQVHVVMELIGGGDLLSEVLRNGPLKEEEAKELFRQLVEAVAHCHAAGVMHRDIKPDNVLLHRDPPKGAQHDQPHPDRTFPQDCCCGSTSGSTSGSSNSSSSGSSGSSSSGGLSDNRRRVHAASTGCASPFCRNTSPRRRPLVKLVDFALSEVASSHVAPCDTARRDPVGTKQYMAPEVRSGVYSAKADVYSLGITLFAVLTGRLPAIDQKLGTPMPIDFGSSHMKGLSAEAVDVLRQMLQTDPNDRMSAMQLLQHPWLSQVNAKDSVAAAALHIPVRSAWSWIEAF